LIKHHKKLYTVSSMRPDTWHNANSPARDALLVVGTVALEGRLQALEDVLRQHHVRHLVLVREEPVPW
jgi:hypothetical protein